MKNLHLKIMLMTIVMAFITAFSAQPVLAQSSYLDTIYQAVEGEGVSTENEALAAEEGGVVIDAGGDASVTVSDDAPSADKAAVDDETSAQINLVLADMTRILIGMNIGVPIKLDSFTLIDLTGGSSDKPADDKKDDDKPADDKKDDETPADDKKDDETPADDKKDDETPADDKKDDETPADDKKDDETPADDKKDDETPADDKKDDETPADDKKDDETPADDKKDDETTSAESVDDLKSKIQSTYNIKCSDGTSNYTVRQLQLIDEVLGKLPSSFRENTTEIIRDKENTEDKDSGNTLGYVIKPQSKVHVLDLAAHYSEADIEAMEKSAGRTLTQNEVIRSLEFQYARTIAHEMTHCYQNDKGASVAKAWAEKFWADGKNPTGSLISNYAKTSYEEDMAESVSFYVMGGVITEISGKKVYKVEGYSNYMDYDRYEFIRDKIMGGKEFRTDIKTGSEGISI